MSLLNKILKPGARAIILGVKIPQLSLGDGITLIRAIEMGIERPVEFGPPVLSPKDFFRGIVENYYSKLGEVAVKEPFIKEVVDCRFVSKEDKRGPEELFVSMTIGEGGVVVNRDAVPSIKEFDTLWTLFCYPEGKEDLLAKGILEIEALKVTPENEVEWQFFDPHITRKRKVG